MIYKHLIKLLLVISGILFLFRPATGQTSHVVELLSLFDAWNRALEKNPDFAVYQMQVKNASSELKASRSNLFPIVTGNASGQRNFALSTTFLPGEIFGQPGETIEAQFGQNYNYNAGITVSRTLGWQNFLEIEMARNSVTLSEAEQAAFEQSLKQQVALYYYTVLITREALKLNEKDLALSDSIVSLMYQEFQEGTIDAMQKNQALINRNSVLQNQANNQSLLQQCYQQLSLLLGIESTDTLLFSEAPDHHLVRQSSDVALGTSQTIAVKAMQLSSAETSVKLRKAAYVPTVSANLYWGKQQFRDDFGISFDQDDWSDYQYFSVGLSIPIFSGFSNKNELAAARVNVEIAQKQYENERRKTRINDQQLVNDYQNNLIMTRAAYDNYQLYEENQQLAHQKYNEGLISLDAYFQVFEDFLKAENAYLNALSALYSYYSSIISRQ